MRAQQKKPVFKSFSFFLIFVLLFFLPAGESFAHGDETDKKVEALLSKTFDIVILNGRVMDPETGRDENWLNIGITGNTIEIITSQPIEGKLVIDAKNRVVSPGFIDVLSYNPNDFGVWYKIYDGVTTNLAMHGGAVDTSRWYGRYEKRGVPVNFGAAFFYNRARLDLGLGFKGTASKAQVEELKRLAVEGLRGGALGIGMSMEYAPGTSRDEVRAMMEVAAFFNVPVFFHLRYSDMEEPGTNFEALDEVLSLARETGAGIHIDHINSTGGTFSMKESLAMIVDTIESGIFVTACTYPYPYWATYLNSARYGKGWQNRFKITYSDLQLGGSTEILTEVSFKKYQKLGKLAVAYAIPPEDVVDAFKFPFTMVGSDGIIQPHLNNHPRGAGAFARTISEYVYGRGGGREDGADDSSNKDTLTLMEAIRKMTILPALRLEAQVPSLKKKARVQVGMDADLLVFDPLKVKDKADVIKPNQLSVGFDFVIINGKIVKDENGLNKTIRAGISIKGEFEEALFEAVEFGELGNNLGGNKHKQEKEFLGEYWKENMDGRQIN